MSIEKDIQRMQEITTLLKSSDTALDEAMKLFEEGVGIAKRVEKQLQQMEQKVEQLIGVSEEQEAIVESFEP
ncbi:MAG: exodeoxyribonuclease VII small subunit [Sphaerochaetaceae bacterium]|jgi:exodeoxyribonuclease VII small subunit